MTPTKDHMTKGERIVVQILAGTHFCLGAIAFIVFWFHPSSSMLIATSLGLYFGYSMYVRTKTEETASPRFTLTTFPTRKEAQSLQKRREAQQAFEQIKNNHSAGITIQSDGPRIRDLTHTELDGASGYIHVAKKIAREELAQTMFVHHSKVAPQAQAVRAEIWLDGEVRPEFTEDAYRLADAVIAAGWTPPLSELFEASIREEWDQAVAKVNAAVEYLNRIGMLKDTYQKEGAHDETESCKKCGKENR